MKKQLGSQIHNSGTADSPWFIPSNHIQNKFLSIQFYILHSACDGSHPGFHASALQGRACCPGAADQKIPVAHNQLPVCPHVQKYSNLLFIRKSCGYHAADNISSHIIRFRRIAVDISRKRKSQLLRPQKIRMISPYCIRRGENAESVHPNQEMHHRHIPRYCHGRIILRCNACFFLNCPECFLKGPYRGKPDFLQMLCIVLCIKNPAQNIRPKSNLFIIDAFLR